MSIECKNHHICEKNYVWNPDTCNCENGKYLACIIDKIICDEIIDLKETNFNEKNITCETQSFDILLTSLLITITLLTAVSIYCYLTKYQAKNLLPFYNANNKLNKFCINSIN